MVFTSHSPHMLGVHTCVYVSTEPPQRNLELAFWIEKCPTATEQSLIFEWAFIEHVLYARIWMLRLLVGVGVPETVLNFDYKP